MAPLHPAGGSTSLEGVIVGKVELEDHNENISMSISAGEALCSLSAGASDSNTQWDEGSDVDKVSDQHLLKHLPADGTVKVFIWIQQVLLQCKNGTNKT